MGPSISRSVSLLVVLLVTGFAVIIPAQVPRIPGITKGKDKDDEAKLREKEKARATRDAGRYERLKTFSLNLYQTDPDFHDDVDQLFDEVQRAHSLQAFEKNVAPPARPTVVHDGDRLRLQTGLYDNKLVADYLNRVGQRLVPGDSEKLFAFRLVAYPIPFAETLSTGTIYVSTGLISLLDNEAQLAYVLGHEMAHVQLDHWKLKSILNLGQEEFNKKEATKRRWIGAGLGALGGAVGGRALGESAVSSGLAGAAIGFAIGNMWAGALTLDWDTVQENQADDVAFKALLNQNYEVREVPKLYATLQTAVRHDQRVGLAFMGDRRRIAERIANVDDMITRELKPVLDGKQGNFVVTHPDFVRVMSTLKRDNGILSFYHDMFQLAKSNLEYARHNRPNDPSAHYYYGKVMKLVGRTDEDKKLADDAFQKAIQFDRRERNYGAYFYRALALIDQKNSSLNPEIAKSLQLYLMASIRFASEEASLANALPANLDDLYDYLAEAGDVNWQPTVPDDLKQLLIRAGTDNQKTESPLKRAPSAPEPSAPKLPNRPAAGGVPAPSRK
ncbi:MAG: M48 family metalloprotease [Acidobacteriota bacterium]